MRSILLIGILAVAITVAHGGFFWKKAPQNVFIIKQHELVKTHAPSDCEYHEIEDTEEALIFLQKSGKSVKKLILHAEYMSIAERHAISQSIAKHCAKSLIEFEYHEGDNALITDTKQIFSKVRTLKVNNVILPQNMQIARIYPALQKLSVQNIPGYEWTDNNWERIRQQLPSIAHIRSLELNGHANPILKSIADTVSKLETLSIGYDGDIGLNTSVHFNTVKEFDVTITHGIFPEYRPLPVTFDRLEELKLSTFQPYPQLLEWLRQNVELKRITAHLMTDEEFLDVVGHLPKLEHVTFELTLESESAPYLNRMKNVDTVSFVTKFGTEKQEMLDTLPDDWRVVDDWKFVNGTGYVLGVARKPSASDEAESKIEHFFDQPF